MDSATTDCVITFPTSCFAIEIIGIPDVNGCLVGGASLKAHQFNDICQSY